jgi:hypothetical protein
MTIALEILKIKGPDGTEQYKAIISLKDAIADSSQSKKLIRIQDAYNSYVQKSRELWVQMKRDRSKMADSFLQWKLADFLFSFCEFTHREGYILSNLPQAIVRDIGISQSQTNYLRKFRMRYQSIDKISPKINWSKYRELMDISSVALRTECEQKILNGEIHTDSEIRAFKRSHRFKK